MPPLSDWRCPADWTEDSLPGYSEVAIGYASRNPDYRKDYRRALRRVAKGRASAGEATAALLRRWGATFHVDPASPRDPALVVTRPGLSPDVIMLGHPPPKAPSSTSLDMAALAPARASLEIGQHRHIILPDRDGDARIWLLAPPDGPLSILLPLGPDLGVAIAAAERLRRLIRGLCAGPPAMRLPPVRRAHHLNLLRALDGREQGASRRELAAILIDAAVLGYSAAAWVESNERKRISRWLAEAIELRDGGYLRLLRGR
jgi:hypothetical protein